MDTSVDPLLTGGRCLTLLFKRPNSFVLLFCVSKWGWAKSEKKVGKHGFLSGIQTRRHYLDRRLLVLLCLPIQTFQFGIAKGKCQ